MKRFFLLSFLSMSFVICPAQMLLAGAFYPNAYIGLNVPNIGGISSYPCGASMSFFTVQLVIHPTNNSVAGVEFSIIPPEGWVLGSDYILEHVDFYNSDDEWELLTSFSFPPDGEYEWISYHGLCIPSDSWFLAVTWHFMMIGNLSGVFSVHSCTSSGKLGIYGCSNGIKSDYEPARAISNACINMECPFPIATQNSSWGAIKQLYR
jgi:hypothetical protein